MLPDASKKTRAIQGSKVVLFVAQAICIEISALTGATIATTRQHVLTRCAEDCVTGLDSRAVFLVQREDFLAVGFEAAFVAG
jgi:hypothetical protein